jgi:site-specific DNA-methyltransferase (adenine-specific)
MKYTGFKNEFHTDLLHLYQCDNMELLKQTPDNYYELAIVDPPYGINSPNMQMGSAPNRKEKGQYPGKSTAVKNRLKRLNGGGGKLKNRVLNTSKIDWDYEKPTEKYFNELFRVSKNQIIWGGNYFDLNPTRCVLCWDKVQPWENFSQWEMAWTSFDKPAAIFKYSNTGGANKEKKTHPTQKPVKLYMWLLDKFAKQGDKILDTHLGSMSIAIACHDYGFELTGCELDKDYFNDGINRVKNHISQLTLDFK